jgi:hypothetical protein
MSKEIKLTQGKVTIVDAEDYDFLSQWKWYCDGGGYARRNSPRGDGKRVAILMHRFILDAPKGVEIDHRNRDTLDNRKSNLRLCNREENCRNKKKHSNNRSGYKGVSRHNDGRWQAEISVSGQKKYLGRFDTKEEAAKIYDKEALKHFGEFAYLNFPYGGIIDTHA